MEYIAVPFTDLSALKNYHRIRVQHSLWYSSMWTQPKGGILIKGQSPDEARFRHYNFSNLISRHHKRVLSYMNSSFHTIDHKVPQKILNAISMV